MERHDSEQGDTSRSLSMELALFIATTSFADLPPRAVQLAERCFVDTVGVGIAGSTSEAGAATRKTIEAIYRNSGQASLWGRNTAVPIPEAAFVNGVASHAVDYDDYSSGMDGHPSTTMVAPLLALAEALEVTGREIITAFVVGFETQCFIARPNLRGRTGSGLHARQWHPTPIFGTFGAAAATASLLDCNADETHHALNVSTSMAAGLLENVGTLTKPMHSGHAAQSGLRATLLAKNGLTASTYALSRGFLPVYAGVNTVDRSELPELGAEWSVLEMGVDVKKYPACFATQTTIHAVAQLTEREQISAADVARVHLVIPQNMADVLLYDDPQSESEAKFSIPYAVASALKFDEIGIETFRPGTIQDTTVQELLERVEYEVDSTLPADSREITLTIETTTGERYTKTQEKPPATHENPLSDEELKEKFCNCAAHVLPQDSVENAYTCLRNLRDTNDAQEITTHLQP